MEALDKWFKDTPASRPFLIKYFNECGYTVNNTVVAKLYLIYQGYSEADASAAGTAAMTSSLLLTHDQNSNWSCVVSLSSERPAVSFPAAR